MFRSLLWPSSGWLSHKPSLLLCSPHLPWQAVNQICTANKQYKKCIFNDNIIWYIMTIRKATETPSVTPSSFSYVFVDCVWNVMAHGRKPDFVYRRNGRVHLNRQGRQFIRLLAAEVRASAVVMLDTPCSQVVWRLLANHAIRRVPLHFPSRASPCAITFQLDSTTVCVLFIFLL